MGIVGGLTTRLGQRPQCVHRVAPGPEVLLRQEVLLRARQAYLPHGGWWSDQEVVRALGEEHEMSLVGSANKRYDTDLFFVTLWVQNRWQADEWMLVRFGALDDEAALTGRTGDSVILNTTQRDGRFQYEYTVQSGSAACGT